MTRSRAFRRFRYYVKKRWAKQIWKLTSNFLSDEEIKNQQKHGYDTLIGKLATTPKHFNHEYEEEKKHYSRSKQKHLNQMLLKEAL
jgi:hypothetical protein